MANKKMIPSAAFENGTRIESYAKLDLVTS